MKFHLVLQNIPLTEPQKRNCPANMLRRTKMYIVLQFSSVTMGYRMKGGLKSSPISSSQFLNDGSNGSSAFFAYSVNTTGSKFRLVHCFILFLGPQAEIKLFALIVSSLYIQTSFLLLPLSAN